MQIICSFEFYVELLVNNKFPPVKFWLQCLFSKQLFIRLKQTRYIITIKISYRAHEFSCYSTVYNNNVRTNITKSTYMIAAKNLFSVLLFSILLLERDLLTNLLSLGWCYMLYITLAKVILYHDKYFQREVICPFYDEN